jgi:putative transposase
MHAAIAKMAESLGFCDVDIGLEGPTSNFCPGICPTYWLYHVFSLSLRDVELILAERGVIVSHESIRRWCLKFGQAFADKLRRRRPRPGDKWHLDEVLIPSANSVCHPTQGVIHELAS